MKDARVTNHNVMAGKMAVELLSSVFAAGGNEKDACMLLQSVCAGVLSVVTKPGGEAPVMETIAKLAIQQARDIRRLRAEAAGSA